MSNVSRVYQAAPAGFQYNPRVIATQAVGVVLSKVAMTLIDRVIYPEPKLTELRDEMVKVIDENEPKVMEARAKRVYVPVESEVRGAPAATSDVTSYIEQSLDALQRAQEATKCKVCKREIGEAARAVQAKLATIQNTDKVYRTMQDLEAQGALPRGAKWSTLKETERELVRRHARS